MATNNKQFKVDFGFDSQATSNVVGDLGVTANVSVGNTLTTNSIGSNLTPSTAGTLQIGNTTNRWVIFSNNITSNGSLVVTGNATLGTAGAFANILSTFEVQGNTIFRSNVTSNGILTVNNTTTLGNSVTMNGDVTITGDRTINVSSGITTLRIGNTPSTSNVFTVNSSLISIGNSTVNTTVTPAAISTVGGGTLSISGNATLSGALQTISGNVNVDSGTLFVDGTNNRVGINNTTPGVALTVTGAVDISSTANIQGVTTLRSTVTANGTLTVNAVTTLGGNSNFGNSTSFTNVLSTFESQGVSTFRANTVVNGQFTVSNTSTLSGNVIFSALINAAANLVLSTTSTILLGGINTTATGFLANSTAIQLGNSTVNSVVNSSSVNVATHFAGVSNSTSNGFVANNTLVRLGNTSIKVDIAPSSVVVGTASATDFATTVATNSIGIANSSGSYLFANATYLRVNGLDTTTVGFAVNGTNSIFDSGVLFVDGTNNRIGINNTAPAVALRVTGDVDISATANVQGALSVAGQVSLSNTGSHTVAGNVTFDSGTLFVDAFNNRIGINNTAPSAALTVTGAAELSSGINAASYTIGTSFIANSTVVYAGVVNGSSHTVGTDFIANSTGITSVGFANVNNNRVGNSTQFITSNSSALAPSANTVLLGNSIGLFVIAANTITTSGLITGGAGANIVGTANITAALYVGTQNTTSNGIAITNASITVGNTGTNTFITPSQVNTSSLIIPYAAGGTTTVNATGIFIGNSTVYANVAAELVKIGNTSGSLNIGTSNSTVVGVSISNNEINVGNVASFAKLSPVNGITHSTGGTLQFAANTTNVFTTGTFSTSANATGGLFLANSGVVSYGNSTSNVSITSSGLVVGVTGVIPVSNATGSALGNTTNRWILNANSGNFSGGLTVSGAVVTSNTFSANGTTGTAGFVLKTGGAGANAYWGEPGAAVTDDTTAATTRYPLFANATSGVTSTSYVASTKLSFIPSTGTLYAVVFSATSDETLKENIRPIEDPTRILNIDGKHFNFIDDKTPASGFIAQQVQQYIPEAVSNNDGVLSVNPIPIVAYLLEHVKIQQKTIEYLSERIDILARNK